MRRRTGLISDRLTAEDTSRTVWSRVFAAPSQVCYVERPTGWVALDEPDPADVTAGYRILRGGYRNEVTGQDLSDMVDDGAMTAATACSAEVQTTLFGLTDDLGNQLVTSEGQPLQAALVSGSPLYLSDAS
jgi:hypothetical protein